MLGVEHGPPVIALCGVGPERKLLLCLRYVNRWRRLTMTTIRSARLGVLLSIAVFAGLGSTGAQAYDPRVTTRSSDLMGDSSARVVRDHRYPGGVRAGGVTVTDTPRDPIVRDHRAEPVVRDHRTSGPIMPDNW